MFNVGDVVEITDKSSSEGMLDFVKGAGYKVKDTYSCFKPQIKLRNDSGSVDWYHSDHFKLKEGKKMETDFRAGQTVWCVLFGKGVVSDIEQDTDYSYPVKVHFADGIEEEYTLDGKMFDSSQNRALFFSEPKVIAETKPAFVPTLKEGTPILLTQTKLEVQIIPAWVNVETRDFVDVATTDSDSRIYIKNEWKIFSVGEKIEFN